MLTLNEIKTFIEEDKTSDKKIKAAEGQRYYEAEHDIMNCRLFYYNADGNLVEDKTRANIKISHPFFTELADQISSYMTSFDENPIKAIESAEGLQDHLDTYFDEEFWAEIGDVLTGAYVKGFDYLYGYMNEDNRLAFEYADSMGVVEVQGRYTADGQDYKIYHYMDTELSEKGKVLVRRIQVWTKDETYYFIQDNQNGEIVPDTSYEINPRPHVVYTDEKGVKRGKPLGFIPFWRLDYNKKQFSGLKPIKGIIDDYDLHSCSLSNNLKDFDTPLHVVSGFQGDNLDELQTNLKTKKIVGVDAEGDVQVRTVDIPYEARKEKLELDEKNIYRFGMGLNTAGLKDTTATTNIAIKMAYTLLDLKANKYEKRLKKFLKEIIEVVLAEINEQHDKDYRINDIYFDFERSVMTNNAENIQNAKVEADTRMIEINTVLNVAANVGDEQTLKAICEVMEWDFEAIQAALEEAESNGTAVAMAALEGVVIDEQTTETGARTIPE